MTSDCRPGARVVLRIVATAVVSVAAAGAMPDGACGGPAQEGVTPQGRVKSNFSTPRKAIQTFIAAAAATDKEALSMCFHPSAAPEFDGIKTRQLSQKQREELVDLFGTAEITGVEAGEVEEIAYVTIKFTRDRGDERITLGKWKGRWAILGF